MRELRDSHRTILRLGVVAALILIWSDTAFGQEKKKLSWSTKPENTKVTVQQVLEVPNIPGHVIRINETRRVWPDGGGPMVEGRKVVEEVVHGFADVISGNGKGSGYSVWRFESGDQTFHEWQLVTQTVGTSDRGRKTTFMGTYVTTGGTGGFKGIKGLGRFSGVAEFNAEGKIVTNELTGEGEYWFEK
jgi:hypothetical protein